MSRAAPRRTAIAAIALVAVVPVVRAGAAETPPSFVGRDACARCHAVELAAWQGSHHDLAMSVAADGTVRADFDDASLAHDGITTRFHRDDGRFLVSTEGADGAIAEFEVTHTFGWEPLQQFLVPFPGGRLQALGVAWDTERGAWFDLSPDEDVPPGDWLHWTGQAQNWNGMCADCHSTNLVKSYDADAAVFRTTWSEVDVSCEACHGPGSRHVAWAETPAEQRPPRADEGLVVETGELAGDAYAGLCARCHSRRTELDEFTHGGGELLDHYQPALLREGLYHADGQILDEVYVYGSFAQSRMFREGVTCGDCHDAHSLRLRAEGNALCTRCHRPEVYDGPRHHFHPPAADGTASAGASCVKCHMVERPYMVVDWRADHAFHVPRPDLTESIGVPNACGQSGCHDDRPLSWTLDAFRDRWGARPRPHFGETLAAARAARPDADAGLRALVADTTAAAIVRATALSHLAAYPSDATTAAITDALDDDDALVRSTAVAAFPPGAEGILDLLGARLRDPVRAVRLAAASRLAGAPEDALPTDLRAAFTREVAAWEESMAHSLDFAFGGYNLGNHWATRGDAARAEDFYRKALAVDDAFAPAKNNLALLLNDQGRRDEAEVLLRELVRDAPGEHDAAYSLGLLLAETGRLEEAVAHLGTASAGMPARGRVHYNYGLALRSLGRNDEAAEALERAVDTEPGNADFLYALGEHCLRNGDPRRALELADRILVAAPGMPRGLRLRAAANAALDPSR